MNEHAHVSQHSWAPVIIGTGLLFINAGFVFGLAVGVFGLLIMVAGIITWIREDMRIYDRESDEHGESH